MPFEDRATLHEGGVGTGAVVHRLDSGVNYDVLPGGRGSTRSDEAARVQRHETDSENDTSAVRGPASACKRSVYEQPVTDTIAAARA